MTTAANSRLLALAALALSVLPLQAGAEGARLELACDFVTACDAAGKCGPGDGPVRFVLQPDALDPDGAGRYSIRVDDGDPQPAQGASRTGPFLWMPGDNVRMTLALTGETSAVWIRQSIGNGAETPSGAEIDIMSCEVTF